MQMIGCDLHARQQTLAILDCETGAVEERILEHEGDSVRDFYSGLEGPVRVAIEATAGKSEALIEYLAVMANFPTYSFGNVMLIARQKPTATHVCGMRAWNQMGRFVSLDYHHIGPDRRIPFAEQRRLGTQATGRHTIASESKVPRQSTIIAIYIDQAFGNLLTSSFLTVAKHIRSVRARHQVDGSMKETLLTPREAATALGLRYSTVKSWMLRGKIRQHEHPGGTIVFP
jgi:hypothetical protein